MNVDRKKTLNGASGRSEAWSSPSLCFASLTMLINSTAYFLLEAVCFRCESYEKYKALTLTKIY